MSLETVCDLWPGSVSSHGRTIVAARIYRGGSVSICACGVAVRDLCEENMASFFTTEVIEPLRDEIRGQIAKLMERMERVLSEIATRELRRKLYGDAAADDERDLADFLVDEDEAEKPPLVETESPWWKTMVLSVMQPMLKQVMSEMLNDFHDEMVKAIAKTKFQLEVNVIEQTPPPPPDEPGLSATAPMETVEDPQQPPVSMQGGGEDVDDATFVDPFPYEEQMMT